MMDRRRVFIVGDTVFAQSLPGVLSGDGIEIVGLSPTLQDAAGELESVLPDVVIVAESVEQDDAAFAVLRATCLEIPFVFTSLERGYMQVVSSQCFCASRFDLLTVIAGLPKQNRNSSR
jgi:hypothetical protein